MACHIATALLYGGIIFDFGFVCLPHFFFLNLDKHEGEARARAAHKDSSLYIYFFFLSFIIFIHFVVWT
jgi:hypothetical protein